jgi:hypothetical protein
VPATRSATRPMRSTSATEEPPNFWTTIDIGSTPWRCARRRSLE